MIDNTLSTTTQCPAVAPPYKKTQPLRESEVIVGFHSAKAAWDRWLIRFAKFAFVLTVSLFLAGSALAEVPSAVLEAERNRIEVIEKISKSTIAVFGPGDSAGGGSAVVITPDGYSLTNFHVTKPVGTHLKCGMNDGVMYDAVIVGVDPTGDVALIKMIGRDDFPSAEIGDSDKVRAGDWCIVSGNPFLLATDFHPTITYGIVSGVHRYQYPSGTLLEYADCIQTDASINPGNSGGPLWNAKGQLIGINGRGSFEKRGRVNVGVGYAISINQIKNFMGYLRSGRVVDHATLGATVSTDEDGNVVVTNILSTSDAFRRGLRYGDQILAFGGRAITSTNGFKNTLGIFPKGWRVPLSFDRQGERVDTFVRLDGVHAGEELLAKMELGGIAPPRPNGEEEPERPKPPKDEDKEHDDIKGDGDSEEDEGKPKLIPGRLPNPGRNRHGQSKKELDSKIAKLFAKRRGYSNFYFNELERDRVWKSFLQHGDFGVEEFEWVVTGKLGEAPLEVALGERLAGGRVNKVLERVDFDLELQTQLAPRKTGGLLLALHQWRRLLLMGPKKFGNLFYLGASPLPYSAEFDGLADTFVGTYDVLETRFYFDPEDGRLLSLEMYPDVDVDPCELYFYDYEDVNGKFVPKRIVTRIAERETVLTVDALQFHSARGECGRQGMSVPVVAFRSAKERRHVVRLSLSEPAAAMMIRSVLFLLLLFTPLTHAQSVSPSYADTIVDVPTKDGENLRLRRAAGTRILPIRLPDLARWPCAHGLELRARQRRRDGHSRRRPQV